MSFPPHGPAEAPTKCGNSARSQELKAKDQTSGESSVRGPRSSVTQSQPVEERLVHHQYFRPTQCKLIGWTPHVFTISFATAQGIQQSIEQDLPTVGNAILIRKESARSPGQMELLVQVGSQLWLDPISETRDSRGLDARDQELQRRFNFPVCRPPEVMCCLIP